MVTINVNSIIYFKNFQILSLTNFFALIILNSHALLVELIQDKLKKVRSYNIDEFSLSSLVTLIFVSDD